MSYKILVADDEKEIRQLLSLYLTKDGYEVVEAENGREAIGICQKEQIDLAILDIMMPQMNGYQVIQKIRQDSNIPVIMISAKSQDEDKILGLDLGADDYITKPFNPLEAMARINSNIRRFYALGSRAIAPEATSICVKNLRLETEECVVYRDDEPIILTSVEYKILKLFMENPGKVFTKQQLYEEGWGNEYIVADNNIMVCISKLRNKINDAEHDYIKTIRGLGYRLEK